MEVSHYFTLGCVCQLLMLLIQTLIIGFRCCIRVLQLEAKPIGDIPISMYVFMLYIFI